MDWLFSLFIFAISLYFALNSFEKATLKDSGLLRPLLWGIVGGLLAVVGLLAFLNIFLV